MAHFDAPGRYLRANYEREDWLDVVLIYRHAGIVKQEFATAETISSPRYQARPGREREWRGYLPLRKRAKAGGGRQNQSGLRLYRIGTLLPVKRSAMGFRLYLAHGFSYLCQALKERGFPLLEFTIF